jgi:diguanylate cyclase (GGDEF)-like protein/PAS domain S-box-containing protein
MFFQRPSDFEGLQNNESQETVRLFTRTLATCFLVVLISIPFVWPTLRESTTRVALTSSTLLVTGVAWWAAANNRLRVTRLLVSFGYWVIVTILIVDSGGLGSPWLMTQLAVAGVTGLIVSWRLALGLSVLSLLVDAGFYFVQDMVPTLGQAAPREEYLASVIVNFIVVATVIYLGGLVVSRNAKKARENELRYRSLFEKTNDAVFLIDLDYRQIAVNDNAAVLLGYEPAELVGMHIDQIVEPAERDDAYSVADRLESEGMLPVYERTMVRKDGSRIKAEINVAMIHDEAGKPLYIQSVVRDITERKRLEQQLRENLAEMEDIAMRDSLTALLNRRAISDQVEAEWHRSARQQEPMCLLLIDLDNLKEINDQHGHSTGDEALLTLAGALRRAKRRYDWMGRWGGDEFLMVLPSTNLVEAQEIAERLRSIIEGTTLGEKDGQPIRVQASLGIACYSGRPGEEISQEQLLLHADEALYKAKEDGRNRVAVYRS